MALPVVPLAQDTVNIGGSDVSIKAMSRAQALKLNDYRDRPADAEPFIVSAGTGATLEEAEAFLNANDLTTAGKLIDAILVLSGLATADQIAALEEGAPDPT